MLCALGVVMLGLGSIIEVLDLTFAIFTSLLTVYAVIEIGGFYPWMIWIVTSVVALLLLPLKTPILFYALLSGYYPILKQKIERKMARLPAWALKFCVLAVSIGAIWGVMKLFLPDLLEGPSGWIATATMLVLAIIAFVLYDFALTKLITLYLVRFQKRFKIK